MSPVIIQLAAVFIVPAVLSLILTPYVVRLAGLIGAVDYPNERKVHIRPIPRLGGVGIYASFFLSILFFLQLAPARISSSWFLSQHGILLIGSLLVVLVLGIWDDLRSLTPGRKFVVQVAAATLAYLAGFRISTVTHPLGAAPLVLGVLDYPATILWIVGVSNAFNLIDGLDGLATGIALIASLTIGAIAFLNGDLATTFPVLMLAGALFGFLRYNFNPARIFLGDSGSLFIGFTLATLSIQSSTKGSTAFAIVVPVLSLGLPIMDTLLAMIRRFLGSLLSDRRSAGSFLHKLKIMFLPDRRHVHHQLLALGLSHRKAVLMLYAVASLFGLGAFSVTLSNNIQASLILLGVAVSIVAGIRQLQYSEMAILRNGVLLPLYNESAGRRSITPFIDLAFCAIAWSASSYLTFRVAGPEHLHRNFLMPLSVVCGVQIAVFFLTGLYQNTFRYLGIADLLKIVQTVAAAVIATGLILILLPLTRSYANLSVLVINFYFLMTLIGGSRCSFHILNYIFRRQPHGGKGLLIYGADTRGVLALQQILQDKNREYNVVGFLDDAPSMEGKRINGYPVFGGHWKLPRVTQKYHIEKILIPNDNIQPMALRRLMQFAENQGIGVQRSSLLIEELRSSIPVGRHHPRPFAKAAPIGALPQAIMHQNDIG